MSDSTTTAAAPEQRLSQSSLPSFTFRPKKYVRLSPTPPIGPASGTAADTTPLTRPPETTAVNPTTQIHRTLLLLMELDPGPNDDDVAKCNCCRRARIYKHDAMELDRVHAEQLRTLTTELCHVQRRVLELCDALRLMGASLISQANSVEEGMVEELTQRMEAAAELAEVELIVEQVAVPGATS